MRISSNVDWQMALKKSVSKKGGRTRPEHLDRQTSNQSLAEQLSTSPEQSGEGKGLN